MLTEIEKRKLSETPVTLDGEDAKICGVKEKFATIRGKCDVVFAWATVARVVENGGNFKS